MLTTTIRRSYYCESAHFLPHVPDGHKCKRVHGHHYQFDVVVKGPMSDQTGWLMDFWVLDDIFKPLFDKMDHHLLNDLPGLDNPTAEVIAAWIHRHMKPLVAAHSPQLQVAEVHVFETKDCRASVYDDGEVVQW